MHPDTDSHTFSMNGRENADVPDRAAGAPARTDAPGPVLADAAARALRRPRWPLAVAGVLLLVALVAAGVVGLVHSTRVSRATGKLDSAVSALSAGERTVVAVDAVLQAQITPELETSATAALAALPAARREVGRAVTLITAATPDLAPDDRTYAVALKQAAAARVTMLAQAEPVLAANAQAARALRPARLAWASVASAQRYSDDAVANFNKHTKGGVTISKKRSAAALALLAAARSQLTSASAAFPQADMKPFSSYIAARSALLKRSIAIDTLWLSGKVAQANAALPAYGKQEAAVIAQGRKLPGTPTAAIADAYESRATSATDAYFAARDRARAADSKVRSLGRAAAGD